MRKRYRFLTGLLVVVALGAVMVVAAGLFQGKFTRTVPLTVVSQRAGLVMNPDAKVTLLGVPIGAVSAVSADPDGNALVHLRIDPRRLEQIPANVRVVIASPTVFGAKSVDLVPPAAPSSQKLVAGQVLHAGQVTVEINTVFEELRSVLSRVQPDKLDATLHAISGGLDGRGDMLGETLSTMDRFLATLEPSLPDLSRDFEIAPEVLSAYADSATGLMTIADDATFISKTLVAMEHDLDRMLISAIGLGEIGTEVLEANRQPLTDTLKLLVPTTNLTNRYNEALTCALAGLDNIAKLPASPKPGVVVTTGFMLGLERYRYPANLPKVAARGGPQCHGLPDVPFDTRPPFVVADIGANPVQYGNHGILLNSDALKQMLFGPIGGPTRNSAQIGEPG